MVSLHTITQISKCSSLWRSHTHTRGSTNLSLLEGLFFFFLLAHPRKPMLKSTLNKLQFYFLLTFSEILFSGTIKSPVVTCMKVSEKKAPGCYRDIMSWVSLPCSHYHWQDSFPSRYLKERTSLTWQSHVRTYSLPVSQDNVVLWWMQSLWAHLGSKKKDFINL